MHPTAIVVVIVIVFIFVLHDPGVVELSVVSGDSFDDRHFERRLVVDFCVRCVSSGVDRLDRLAADERLLRKQHALRVEQLVEQRGVRFGRVVFDLAAFVFDRRVKSERFFVAARERAFVGAKAKDWLACVVVSVRRVRTCKPAAARLALEVERVRVDFPVNLLPRQLDCVFQKVDELLDVERAVEHVVGDDQAVEVNKNFGLRADELLLLSLRKQLVAVAALVQRVGFVFEEQIQLISCRACPRVCLYLSLTLSRSSSLILIAI